MHIPAVRVWPDALYTHAVAGSPRKVVLAGLCSRITRPVFNALQRTLHSTSSSSRAVRSIAVSVFSPFAQNLVDADPSVHSSLPLVAAVARSAHASSRQLVM